jgi:hypothetical protein
MHKYRAEHLLQRFGAHEKLADLYDDHEDLQDAMQALFPDFEYPNFSHLTIGQIQRRAKGAATATRR